MKNKRKDIFEGKSVPYELERQPKGKPGRSLSETCLRMAMAAQDVLFILVDRVHGKCRYRAITGAPEIKMVCGSWIDKSKIAIPNMIGLLYCHVFARYRYIYNFSRRL